jgi:riboflavin kinase / FMN adenylyltransferase
MHLWETDLSLTPKLAPALTICLGYFDGVHLGHQALIQKAKQLGNPTALLTFDRNPKPGRAIQSITPMHLKKQILANLGIDHLILVQFTEVVKHMTPQAFMDKLAAIGGTDLVCGPDFTFGKDAIGNVKMLQQDLRFNIHIQPHLHVNGHKIATSTIVQYLDEAKVDLIPNLLGRYYRVEGLVGKGLGEGRKMGYPTANIVLDAPYYLPKNGVYITLIKIDGKTYYSLASLGFHPTVANLDHPTLEVFVLNYDANLYEKKVEVAFLHYLRPEQKFPSKEALILQMDKDKARAIAMQTTFPQDF